jgi:hypothetical protein
MDRVTCPQHSPSATYQMVGDEAIIIDVNTGTYYTLNDTGARFWQLMDGNHTIAACADAIAAEYEVESAVVEADLLELAAEFTREGLIIV